MDQLKNLLITPLKLVLEGHACYGDECLQVHLAVFNNIMAMMGGGGDDGGGDGGGAGAVMANLLERIPEAFELIGIGIMAKPLLEIEAEGPFVVVCMQEWWVLSNPCGDCACRIL